MAKSESDAICRSRTVRISSTGALRRLRRAVAEAVGRLNAAASLDLEREAIMSENNPVLTVDEIYALYQNDQGCLEFARRIEALVRAKIARGAIAGGDKLKQLEARRAALKTRLDALSLIDRYNGVLSHLAAGTSADDLKAQVTGLQQDLSSFDVSGITNLVQKAVPYVGVLTQGIALVEDAVKKAKFRDAVNSAQRPLAGILDILIADADDVEDITVQELKRQQDPYREQIDSYSRRFNSRLKGLKMVPDAATTPDLQALFGKINDARQSMNRAEVKPLVYQPGPNAVDPAPVDVDALTALVGQVTTSVIAYNKVEDQIKAQHALIAGYRSALAATKKTFVALAGDIEATQISATSDFIKQALELKKVALQLQEAK